ncbi:MAG: transketolase [Bacteroidales bacterium]|nr:transketolase [Bacteroidales bacterium]MCF8388193.1 transketolase [Bacteroidales bacterium]MCF8399030.1 transketolase [Bacteroidales bacterium]
MNEAKLKKLRSISKEIRKDVLRSLTEAGSGHTGGSLGLADVFTVLYFHVLKHKPHKPDWPDRDRLILSIGHVAPVLYVALAHAGYFPKKELQTLRKLDSRLQGHPGRDHGLPGLELSAGSLGQGLSVAVGMALAGKLDHKDFFVYSLHGDGELQEGSIWEAAMSASHHKLDHLIAIVDRNEVQIDGKTSEVMELEPLADKWRAFGWKVFHCNGHDHKEIYNTIQQAKKKEGKPAVILAKTLMGKGVKSIENDHRWHGKPPAKEQLSDFLNQIEENNAI